MARPPSSTSSVPRVSSAFAKGLVLADGRRVRVRPVGAGDAVAERAFVEALSPDSRRRRFHGALAQLPMALAEAMTRVDFHRQVALVAEAEASDGAPRLVADARYVRDEADTADLDLAEADAKHHGPRGGAADSTGRRADAAGSTGPYGAAAEFAIAVADDWQGHGLGQWLLAELAWHARLAGLATLFGSVLADNAPMLSLLRRAGARFTPDPEDARLVRASVRL